MAQKWAKFDLKLVVTRPDGYQLDLNGARPRLIAAVEPEILPCGITLSLLRKNFS